MKYKRGKIARRSLTFYRINFSYFAPYRILVDGTFIKACEDRKIDIKPRVEDWMGGKCLFYTTSCVVHELANLGEALRPIYQASKRFQKVKCKHEGTIDASSCLYKIMEKFENEERYIMATNDKDLRFQLDQLVGKPSITLSNGVLLFNEPSESSVTEVEKKQKANTGLAEHEQAILKPIIKKIKFEEIRKSKLRILRERRKLGIKSKKKAKGVNPLAQKKNNKQRKNNKPKTQTQKQE